MTSLVQYCLSPSYRVIVLTFIFLFCFYTVCAFHLFSTLSSFLLFFFDHGATNSGYHPDKIDSCGDEDAWYVGLDSSTCSARGMKCRFRHPILLISTLYVRHSAKRSRSFQLSRAGSVKRLQSTVRLAVQRLGLRPYSEETKAVGVMSRFIMTPLPFLAFCVFRRWIMRHFLPHE